MRLFHTPCQLTNLKRAAESTTWTLQKDSVLLSLSQFTLWTSLRSAFLQPHFSVHSACPYISSLAVCFSRDTRISAALRSAKPTNSFFFFYLLTSVLLTNALHWFGYDVRNVDIIGIQSLWAFITPGLFSNGPIWFLLCLFWVNILFYCIILISDHISGHLQIASIVFLSILCGTCGWLASKLSIDLWAFFDTALSAVPFFCFGYILRKYTPILTANKSDRFLPILIIVAGIATWIFRGGDVLPAK